MRSKHIDLTIVIIWLVFLTILPIEQEFSQSLSHEQVIMKAYENWVKATNDKNIEQWSSFLAPDAIFHPPNYKALIGAGAIVDYYLELFTDENFSLNCKQEKVEISKAEDFAWSTGKCEAIFTGSDGKIAKDKSKWMKIWVRMPNGEWKCKINSWSSILNN